MVVHVIISVCVLMISCPFPLCGKPHRDMVLFSHGNSVFPYVGTFLQFPVHYSRHDSKALVGHLP